MNPPVVLAIGGTDPCGGAGLLADVRAITSCGGWAAAVATMVIAQNTQIVDMVLPVDSHLLRRQLHSVLSDLPVAAVKIGAVGSWQAANAIAEALSMYKRVPVVLDPVLKASTGAALHFDEAPGFLAPLKKHVTLLTPNWPEALCLAGLRDDEHPAAGAAAEKLFREGWAAVLLKGGHRVETAESVDFLFAGASQQEFRSPRKPFERAPRGTGCLLASCVATYLARGLVLTAACAAAVESIRSAFNSGVLHLGRGAPVLGLTPGAY